MIREETYLGQKVDANGGLVGVVKGVVHETGDQRCLSNCKGH